MTVLAACVDLPSAPEPPAPARAESCLVARARTRAPSQLFWPSTCQRAPRAVPARVPRRALRGAVTVGGQQVCTLANGRVRCDGWGDFDSCEPQGGAFDVHLPEPALTVSSGEALACAVTTSHSVYCWGWPSSSEDEDSNVCAAHELEPTEIGSLHGRAVSIAQTGATLCAVLDDGSAACGTAPRVSAPARAGVASTTIGDLVPLRTEDGPLTGVREIELTDGGGCAMDVGNRVWCWGALGSVACDTDRESCRVARVRDLPPDTTELRCDGAGCCAYGPAHALSCWGGAGDALVELVRDVPDWVDIALDGGEACVAAANRVECVGRLRPGPGSPWAGLRVRGATIVGLDVADGRVCAATTGEIRCWGETLPPPRGVTPIVGSTHWRLAPGEHALRTQVRPLRCVDDGWAVDGVEPTMRANTTSRLMRVALRGVLYNCGHDPPIDARLRTDGSVEIGIGDTPRDAPIARCECRFDLDVIIRGVPAGTHLLTLEGTPTVEPIELVVPSAR